MNTPDKLSLKKYSPKLRRHVVFTETKKNLGGSEDKVTTYTYTQVWSEPRIDLASLARGQVELLVDSRT